MGKDRPRAMASADRLAGPRRRPPGCAAGAEEGRPALGSTRQKEKPASGSGLPPVFYCEVKLADKPGSVVGNHSSGRRVATPLKQPTRKQREPRLMLPYLVLLRMGFAVPSVLPRPR